MQTYSHYIITAALNRWVKKRQATQSDAPNLTQALPPMETRAVMLGSIAPDLPLIFFAIIFLISDLIMGRLGSPGEGGNSSVGWLFRELFFTSPWIKGPHNLFHAPLLTVSYLLLGRWAWKRGKVWGGVLFWFGAATTLHTAIDIPLHYDDGPLLFFPFNWNLRFYSPLSYWDPNRYGRQFTLFEHGLVLILLGYLLWGWWKQRRQAKAKTSVSV